MIKLEKNTSNK